MNRDKYANTQTLLITFVFQPFSAKKIINLLILELRYFAVNYFVNEFLPIPNCEISIKTLNQSRFVSGGKKAISFERKVSL